MEGIFTEFENENSLRAYPFAAWCVPSQDASLDIPAGVFVDAAIYPVNPVGSLYLSSISEDGVFSISDDTGVVMTGTPSGNRVEFFDETELKRHVGTLVASSAESLSEFSGRMSTREFERENTTFSSSCVFPVVIDGVTSVSVDGLGMTTGIVGFSNGPDDEVRASSGTTLDGRSTLRFDVIPKLGTSWDSIRRIICVVDGKTPFRIRKHQESYNTVILTLDSIDKDAICTAAHRENDFEMADTCECEQQKTEPVSIPDTYQIEEVFIPPTQDRPNGADNAFYLVVPNMIGYVNPISITLEDGMVAPKVDDLEFVVSGNEAELADGEMIDDVTAKGVVIQVPGLSGGMI